MKAVGMRGRQPPSSPFAPVGDVGISLLGINSLSESVWRHPYRPGAAPALHHTSGSLRLLGGFLSDWIDSFESWGSEFPLGCVCEGARSGRARCYRWHAGSHCEAIEGVLSHLGDRAVAPIRKVGDWQQWFRVFVDLVERIEAGGFFHRELSMWKESAAGWVGAGRGAIGRLAEGGWNEIDLGRPIRWSRITIG